MDPLRGQTLLSRYRVEAFMGRGGMAEVYKAWDSRRATHVALKFLREDLAQDVVFLRKFRREAAVLQSLEHPNIVRFYGFEEEGLLAFLILQFVEGTSLRAIIRLRQGQPMTSEETLQYLEPICSALHYAHQEGVYHCDVKPGNILIENVSARVLVSDFGVAKLAESATLTTSTPGTPAYMSPEQCRGKGVDLRTDVYSLGITLYEMVTGGERPFTGEKAPLEGSTGEKIRWEHLNQVPPSPRLHNPEITPEIEGVIFKALAKEPRDRYGSVIDLVNAYQQAVGQTVSVPTVEPAPPTPLPPPPAPRKATVHKPWWRRLSPTQAVAAILCGGVILAVAGMAMLSLLKPDAARAPFSSLAPAPTATVTANPAHTLVEPTMPVLTSTVTVYPVDTPAPSTPTTLPPTSTPARPTPTASPTVLPPPPTPLGGGERIAFSSDRDGDFAVYVMNSDGTGTTRLTHGPGGDTYPHWSPDGERIAFVSDRDGNQELYVINQDGSSATRLTSNADADYAGVWSPDGTRLAFETHRDGNLEIYTMSLDGTRQVNITQATSQDGWPSWSPDGTRIAFQSYRDGNWEIYLMDADGSEQRNLTNSARHDEDAAWSPDGRHVAFASDHGYGNYEICVWGADGSGITRLTTNSTMDRAPTWSPDGAQIAFYCRPDTDGDGMISGNDKSADVCVANADGSQPANLSMNPADDILGGWSPDGEWIAFHSDRDGNSEIYIMRADGSQQTRLTYNEARDTDPSWGP